MSNRLGLFIIKLLQTMKIKTCSLSLNLKKYVEQLKTGLEVQRLKQHNKNSIK